MKDNRNLIILVLALALMMVVMAAATIILAGLANREKVTLQSGWRVGAPNAGSINITDMTGDGERDIFVQHEDGINVLDAQRNVLVDRPLPEPIASTQGDATGDGIPDILAYTWEGGEAKVVLFTGLDQTLWERTLPGLGPPGRALALDFENDGLSEFVLGDEIGQLVALSSQGEQLWANDLLFPGTLRGLDEISLATGDQVTARVEEGQVIILDAQGNQIWSYTASGGLRRLRAFPLGGPQNGRLEIGSVNGLLSVHDGQNGSLLWQEHLGQAVNEIRPVEVDGNPATTEIAAGGKDGGVWVLSQEGEVLWNGFMGDKVTEIGGLSDEALDSPVVIFGDDTGSIAVFSAEGDKLVQDSVDSSVSRIEVGVLGDSRGAIVADGSQMRFYDLAATSAPFWYSPLIGGVIACLIIVLVALALTRVKPAPRLQVSSQEMTVEAQRARRRMLHESIHDLKQMQGSGEVSGQAYLARMKELRAQLADTNEALLKLGEPIQPETFNCPYCNGTLELGTDRCEYCGQIVIV